MNFDINIDINIKIDIDPPTRAPRPRLRTVPVWGEGVWGDINIHIGINTNIDIHITIKMSRPQTPARRPAVFLFRLAFVEKTCFCNVLTLFVNTCVIFANNCKYLSILENIDVRSTAADP